MSNLSFLFGTVGSPGATPPRPGGTVGGIRYAASIGLDALELAWVQGVRVGEAACAAIRKTSEEAGVALSVHAPYYINLNGADEKWPRLRKYLMDAAHFGNLAGATDIIFHPGTYFGRPADEVSEASSSAPAGLRRRTARSRQPGHPASGDQRQSCHAGLPGGCARDGKSHSWRAPLH